ncbi:MAG: SRPBCC family protein [Dehalococcoidia bacterium]
MVTPSQQNKAVVTRVGDRGMHTERVFNAPRARVWRAYSEPELVAQWWGRGNKLVVETFEFWKGGHWRFVEHADGEEAGFEGRFREIEPLDLIEQTFEWDGMPGHVSVDSARFSDTSDGKTLMVIDSLFMTAEDCAGMFEAGMEGGMNESYAALDRLLETL